MSPFRTVLCATDFSMHSEHAVRLAGSLARDSGAQLVLLHVVPHTMLGQTLAQLEDYEKAVGRLSRLRPAGVAVDHTVSMGDAAERILATAAAERADLIVLGTHGRTGTGRLLLGSVAERVLRRAACPVLTVKTPTPAATACA